MDGLREECQSLQGKGLFVGTDWKIIVRTFIRNQSEFLNCDLLRKETVIVTVF